MVELLFGTVVTIQISLSANSFFENTPYRVLAYQRRWIRARKLTTDDYNGRRLLTGRRATDPCSSRFLLYCTILRGDLIENLRSTLLIGNSALQISSKISTPYDVVLPPCF